MTDATIRATVLTVFGRLFESGFATLDGIAVSCRTDAGMDYIDGTAALATWLDDRVSHVSLEPEDPQAMAIHRACYESAPGHDAVISGWSRHLRALLQAGHPPPPATSMMRNRGVPDLSTHLVAPEALTGTAVGLALARAAELARTSGMRHHLLITTEGYVVVSGAPPYEAMAHWHNVEMAARVECLRLEDVALAGED